MAKKYKYKIRIDLSVGRYKSGRAFSEANLLQLEEDIQLAGEPSEDDLRALVVGFQHMCKKMAEYSKG